jgi:hypothetical protein
MMAGLNRGSALLEWCPRNIPQELAASSCRQSLDCSLSFADNATIYLVENSPNRGRIGILIFMGLFSNAAQEAPPHLRRIQDVYHCNFNCRLLKVGHRGIPL